MKRLVLLSLALLASCATVSPEAKVRDRLIEAGVKPRMAGCMAEKLTRKLSIGQLRELGRAAALARKDAGRMSIDELAGRLRAVGDPRIVEVVTRAGLGCLIAG